MNTYVECPHGDLLDEAFACTPCQIAGTPPRIRSIRDFEPPPRADAQFSGPCPTGCGKWIAEGDRIVLVDDEWVCRECGL